MERDDAYDDWHRLKQHYRDTADPETAGRVQAVPEPPMGRETFEALLHELDFESGLPADPTPAEAYRRFQHRVSEQTRAPERASTIKHAPRTPALRTRTLRVALASMLVVILAVLGARLIGPGSSSRAQVYQTAPGQRSTVRLADGSTMILGPATTVTSTTHEVDVTGEAYFTIAPRAARSFSVRTANALVHVLGTQFSVRHYPRDTHSRIVVEDGKVSVRRVSGSSTASSPTVLSAHMMAHVSDSGVAVMTDVSTSQYTSWTRGTLVFRGVALREAAAEIARAYGVEIEVADSVLANSKMRMDVSVSDDALSDVLDRICQASGAHYTRRGRTFVLASGLAIQQGPSHRPVRQTSPQPEKQYGR